MMFHLMTAYLLIGGLLCLWNLTPRGMAATQTRLGGWLDGTVAVIMLVMFWPAFVIHAATRRRKP